MTALLQMPRVKGWKGAIRRSTRTPTGCSTSMTETSFTGRSEAIPTANPAVVLHGGQGSGCTMGVRRYFDPSAYRIVLFDQRGCGRSTPHASAPDTDLRPGIRHGRIV